MKEKIRGYDTSQLRAPGARGMTIQTALAQSAKLSDWLDASIHGLDIPSGDREAMAGALLDQVQEHHKAIQLLIKDSLVGSAFSLLRSTFETHIRGVWLLRCASVEEVENFKKDRLDKPLGALIQEIEACPGYDVDVFSKVKTEGWGAMCSYTHGGYLQAVRRIVPGQIAPNYSEGAILEVIRSSDTIALLAASEIFSMAKQTDLTLEVLERMRGLSC